MSDATTNVASGVTETQVKGLARRIKAQADAASKRTKILGAGLLAAAVLAGTGYGYSKYSGPSVIESKEVAGSKQGSEVKVTFTMMGGLKTPQRVLLNNFSVPFGTKFAEYSWKSEDLTVVIDKSNPAYANFMPSGKGGRLAGGGTYEIVGTTSSYNGHPQIIAKTIVAK